MTVSATRHLQNRPLSRGPTSVVRFSAWFRVVEKGLRSKVRLDVRTASGLSRALNTLPDMSDPVSSPYSFNHFTNAQLSLLLDRKEKPFKCNFCESTFARKDVIKRHNLRYHASLPEVRMATTAAQNTVSNMNALAAEERHQTTHSEHSPALVLPTTANGIYLEGGQDNFAALPYLSQPSLVPTDANSLLDSIGYTFTADDMLFGGTGAFDDGMNEMQSMALNALNSSPSSLSTEVNRKHWRGSWEISVAKRSELEREVQAALSRVSNERDSTMRHSQRS